MVRKEYGDTYGTNGYERRYENDPTNRLYQHHPWKLTPDVNIFHGGGRCIWQELQECRRIAGRHGCFSDIKRLFEARKTVILRVY